MELLHNEDLSRYSNFKIGGIANNFYIPENTEELLMIINNSNIHDLLFLSNGSNILINDKKTFENVCLLKKFNTSITRYGNGQYKIGASVSLQKLVKTINEDGYGSIENLFSVPGLVGSSVAMNAGTGPNRKIYIGDFVKEVSAIKDGIIQKFTQEQCGFSHRNSLFKTNMYIITEVLFEFPQKSDLEIKNEIRLKKEIIKQYQDYNFSSLGSIFSINNYKIMKISKMLSALFFWHGIQFSKVANNWLINKGSGRYKQALLRIRIVMFLHLVFRKKCKLEITIWK